MADKDTFRERKKKLKIILCTFVYLQKKRFLNQRLKISKKKLNMKLLMGLLHSGTAPQTGGTFK